MEIILVGTGYMANEYAKVLDALKVEYIAVGRNQTNCDKFKEQHPNVEVVSGGIENFIPKKKYSHAIITSNVDYLSLHTKAIINLGVSTVLVEKPAGKNYEDIIELNEFSKNKNAKVFVAYNRRFYSSVLKCIDFIKEDGEVKSFNFEFTEWPSTMESLPNYDVVRNNLLFANSTHVIDLAFYLGGFPEKIKTFSADKLEWHQKAIYAGAGISKEGALFSYHANWKAPGRWVVEILTEKHRFLFKPMEQLQIQNLNSVKVEPVEIDNKLDVDFKPGLYLQTKSFLFNPDNPSLLTLQEQAKNCAYYQQILVGN